MDRYAQHQGVSIDLEVPSKAIQVHANPAQLTILIDGLLSHTIRWGSPAGRRKLLLETTSASMAHVLLEDKDAVVDEKQLQNLFEKSRAHPAGAARFAGLGISLHLAKEIITAQAGKIWASGKPGKGITYHITLPQTGG